MAESNVIGQTERFRRVLLVHLHVVEKSDVMRHAIAKQHQHLEFRGSALGVDCEKLEERLQPAGGPQ